VGIVVRAAPHEDINLITLLCGATDSGLELQARSGRWIEIPARPDEIVADVGDMLARITNGWLPSTTHRVIARGASARRHRYSLPFFAHPRPECELRVLPSFVTRDMPARFPPITAQAFLEERLREIGLVS
jgi:isopenicillin N synthase-like dioxygenase